MSVVATKPSVTNRAVRIMFVDNDLDYLAMVELAARTEHTFIAIENGGISALGKLAKMNYEVDAVITDLAMRDMDGITLTEQIRRNEFIRRKEHPIRMYWFTGFAYERENANDPITRSAIQNNVKKVFTKPYDVQKIFEEVKADILAERDAAPADGGVITGD